MMKITVSDSKNPPEQNKPGEARSIGSAVFTDQWFERDKLVEEFKFLIDPSQEFVERSKVLAAIRLGMMIDEDEVELPAQPVILDDTQAMKELDKVLAEYNPPPPKPENPAPPA